MKIWMVKPGQLSTVQDLGRANYLADAVPLSGAMDRLSAQIANIAVGNNPGCAVIEFTRGGVSFIMQAGGIVAFSGGGADLYSDEFPIPSGRPVFIPEGTHVQLRANQTGCRSYLAIAGGFDVPVVLGSRSTCLIAKFGGFNGRSLQQGDELSSTGNLNGLNKRILHSLMSNHINYPSWQISPAGFRFGDDAAIRVLAGREMDWFDEYSKQTFFKSAFTLGRDSNRMGYRLTGPNMERVVKEELLSTAVVPGTVQVTGNGDLILLMADAQTTGGYPRMAQVAAVDMPVCAQLGPGDMVRFRVVSQKEAAHLYLEQHLALQKAWAAVIHKYS
jgi:antagonist of KipI